MSQHLTLLSPYSSFHILPQYHAMTEYFIYKYLLKVRIFRRETSKSVLFSNTAQLIYSFSESSLHIYKAQSWGYRTESLNCSCRIKTY